MSRKDYVEAARILRETPMESETRAALVARFVTMFANDNARFSPSRFREAATPDENRIEARGFADGLCLREGREFDFVWEGRCGCGVGRGQRRLRSHPACCSASTCATAGRAVE